MSWEFPLWLLHFSQRNSCGHFLEAKYAGLNFFSTVWIAAFNTRILQNISHSNNESKEPSSLQLDPCPQQDLLEPAFDFLRKDMDVFPESHCTDLMKSPLLVQSQPAARSRVTPPGWIWTLNLPVLQLRSKGISVQASSQGGFGQHRTLKACWKAMALNGVEKKLKTNMTPSVVVPLCGQQQQALGIMI